MPKRDCRHKANQAWINGVHGISDDRLRDTIDIVTNEGQYCSELLLEGSVTNYKSISTADKKNGNIDKVQRLLLSIHSLHYCQRNYETVVLDEI
jgi:hypothetical protein